MSLSEFFIKKPVFCTVLSVFLIILGLLSLNKLPLRQFPDIERSQITIDTLYPGASSNIIETKITEIIEGQISGIDGMEGDSCPSGEFCKDENKIFIYFPYIKNKIDLIKALLHEYKHYLQPRSAEAYYYDLGFTYKNNPMELEAISEEKNYKLFE